MPRPVPRCHQRSSFCKHGSRNAQPTLTSQNRTSRTLYCNPCAELVAPFLKDFGAWARPEHVLVGPNLCWAAERKNLIETAAPEPSNFGERFGRKVKPAQNGRGTGGRGERPRLPRPVPCCHQRSWFCKHGPRNAQATLASQMPHFPTALLQPVR